MSAGIRARALTCADCDAAAERVHRSRLDEKHKVLEGMVRLVREVFEKWEFDRVYAVVGERSSRASRRAGRAARRYTGRTGRSRGSAASTRQFGRGCSKPTSLTDEWARRTRALGRPWSAERSGDEGGGGVGRAASVGVVACCGFGGGSSAGLSVVKQRCEPSLWRRVFGRLEPITRSNASPKNRKSQLR